MQRAIQGKASSTQEAYRSLARRLVLAAFVSVFTVGLALPALSFDPAQAKSIRTAERRAAAKWPKLPKNWGSVKSYTERLEAYVRDRFGFRQQLLQLNSEARFELGVSTQQKVVVGRSGWAFLRGGRQLDAMDIPRGIPAKQSDVEQRVNQHLQWRDYLSSQDIEYLVLIAPFKSSVYPQHLPGTVQPITPHSQTDQLVAALRRHPSLHVVDPRARLRQMAASSPWPLYFSRDSHWNSLGAYHTYKEVLAAVRTTFPQVEGVSADLDKIQLGRRHVADMQRLLYLGRAYDEHQLKIPLTHRPSYRDFPVRLRARRPIRGCRRQSKTGLRVLFVHDSFGAALRPYFCRTFDAMAMLHFSSAELSKALVKKFSPDLVIYERVERLALEKKRGRP